MRFNVPRPLHGWRAFIGEVGIIVLGVLIALSAEQLVRSVSSRRQADAAIESIRGELGSSYVKASEFAIAEPCIDLQLQMLEQRLHNRGEYRPAPLYTDSSLQFAYRAPLRNWLDDAWQSAIAEGDASNFDRDVRLSIASIYTQIASMRDASRELGQLSWQLRVLTQPIQPDAATRARLIEELEHARGLYAEMALTGNQMVGRIDASKLNPAPADVAKNLGKSGTLKFCREHDLPLAKVEPNG